MAATSIIFKPTLTKIAELTLDCSLEENHSFKSKVSKYPVENGATISDHILNEPWAININGFISNNPLSASVYTSDSLTNLQPALIRAKAAYFDLLQIRSNRQLVTIVTGLAVYSNMAMESLEVPRTNQTGDSLEFTAVFSHVKKVETATIPAEYIKDEVKHTSKKVSKGHTTPRGATRDFDPVASKAKKIKDAIYDSKPVDFSKVDEAIKKAEEKKKKAAQDQRWKEFLEGKQILKIAGSSE